MLDGCEYHGQSAEEVLERWKAPAIHAQHDPPVGLCSCCFGPCLAVMVEVEGLPGVVGQPALCSRCAELTPEQAAAIVARLRAGYPEVLAL